MSKKKNKDRKVIIVLIHYKDIVEEEMKYVKRKDEVLSLVAIDYKEELETQNIEVMNIEDNILYTEEGVVAILYEDEVKKVKDKKKKKK